MVTQQVASALGALVGLIGIIIGLALLLAPARGPSSLGVKVQGEVATFYARLTGIRNAAAGALLLWAAFALTLSYPPSAAPLVAVGLAWSLVQACDALLFGRLGSRLGALSAALLALALLAAAALALLG